MEYNKVKSAIKQVIPRGKALSDKILDTMKTVSTVVGGTLGPGGHPVLIERQEHGLPPIVTKDGVTVFRAIGFSDAASQAIMEAARDASIRTASEAGDGTTTATVLSEAFVRNTYNFCSENKNVSPQVVVQTIQNMLSDLFLPEIEKTSIFGDLSTEDGRRRLKSVATISANGDTDLADAVIRCFDICGDEGNISLVESSGKNTYEVEKIEGYPIPMGYEESLQRFYPNFINRVDLQQIHLEKPIGIFYFGRINDIQTLMPLLEKIQDGMAGGYLKTPNVVVFATGFSESVLGNLMTNWVNTGSINVLPMLVPNNSPLHNAQRNFLDDIAAVFAGTVFDSVTNTLDNAEFQHLGNLADLQEGDGTLVWGPMGVKMMEIGRYRSTVLGIADEDVLLHRAGEVAGQAKQTESQLESSIIRERLAKLTGGIAKLKIVGSSNGDTKERRDRAEDAVCAVRGAIKHGCVPGGGWMLARLAQLLTQSKLEGIQQEIAIKIVYPSLLTPIQLLYSNSGHTAEESAKILHGLTANARDNHIITYNVLDRTWEQADQAGLLDSTPAVVESLKNAISIATLLGTLGGAIVFPRDGELERSESKSVEEWKRDTNMNPADERAY